MPIETRNLDRRAVGGAEAPPAGQMDHDTQHADADRDVNRMRRPWSTGSQKKVPPAAEARWLLEIRAGHVFLQEVVVILPRPLTTRKPAASNKGQPQTSPGGFSPLARPYLRRVNGQGHGQAAGEQDGCIERAIHQVGMPRRPPRNRRGISRADTRCTPETDRQKKGLPSPERSTCSFSCGGLALLRGVLELRSDNGDRFKHVGPRVHPVP